VTTVLSFAPDLRKLWLPPPRLSLSEWAAEHARLSPESSADVGRYRPYPYQCEILDAIGDPRIEQVTVMKSARIGYTKMLNFGVSWYVAQDPCPVMIVQPTIGDAEGYSKEEIEPMVRDMPILSGLISPAAKRDGGNTILKKKFPGGVLHMVGADSPRGFRRTSIRALFLDEVDGWALTAGEEGDQIKLATKRTETFGNRKIVAGSTPTLESTSRIKRLFEQGDQRLYFVPCPSCDKPQVLQWERFHWEEGKPETVHYECEHCGHHIEHHQKRWMVEEARRRQLAGRAGFGWVATNPEVKGHASFHLWTAYSYAANATWEHLAREWEACKGNTEEKKTFINTTLGKAYKGEGDKPEWKKLYDRREQFKADVVPAGGSILFAGVDVQRNRIEVEVVAFGPRMESWSVGYRVFGGDTSQLDGTDSPWQRLGDMLSEEWEHELGGKLSIRIMAVDTGDQTSTVYQWCSKWPPSRVMAVKGMKEGYAQVVGTTTQVGTTKAGKKSRVALNLWPIGVSMIKGELYGWLKQEKPTDESGSELPWGWCHFPEYPEEYFKQLTAEELVPVYHRGRRNHVWEVTRKNGRNEALDCRVYARAASYVLLIHKWSAEDWAQVRKEAGIGAPKIATPATDGPLVVNPRKQRRNDNPWL
jgi:phage terminase large subunit GpA-like protein